MPLIGGVQIPGASSDYTLDAQALFLPTLRGYGDLPDLHIAMSLDETLLELVQELAVASASDIVDPSFDFNGKVRDVMFRWAGVDDVNPSSRGNAIDARVLEFLEAFVGQDFNQAGFGSNPGGIGPVRFLMDSWHSAFDAVATRLATQAGLSGIFTESPNYNSIADTFDAAQLDLVAIENLSAEFDHTDIAASLQFWRTILAVIDGVVGVSNLTQQTIDDLDEIIQGDDLHGVLSYEALIAALDHDSNAIYGDSGNNLILGGGGDDTLFGEAGNDVIAGNGGPDRAYGDEGNDTYIFAIGDAPLVGALNVAASYNRVYESLSEGTDTIRFATGIDPDDVRLWTDSSGNLYVQYSTLDYIYLNGSQTGSASRIGEHVEEIVFADETVWDLTNGLHLRNNDTGRSIYGSTLSDIIEGGNGNDNISGYAGNDILIGGGGNDSLTGGDGNDTLTGGGGGDSLNGGAGDDTYVFATDFGADSILGESAINGSDTILMDGFDLADVRLWTTNTGYLRITSKANAADEISFSVGQTGVSGTYQELAIPNLEQIVFDDTTLSLLGGLALEGTSSGEQLYGTQYDDTLYGVDGNDSLYGNRGNDTLIGGAGNDTLIGAAGDDTYLFAAGFGTDSISSESTTSGTDSIVMDGFNAADMRLWTTNTGYLRITSKANAADDISIYVGQTGASGTYQELAIPNLEQIVFEDTTLSLLSGLTLEGTSSGEQLYGTQYDDTLYGLDGNDTLRGQRGNDTLIGGGGNDTLIGAAGNDTYVFTAGFGTDSISSEGSTDGTDTIFLDGFLTSDVRLWTNSSGVLHITSKATSTDDISFSVGTTGASGTTYELNVPYVEQLVFEDTTTWSLTGGLILEGTASNESLFGSQYNDQLSGMDGNDGLYGNRGNDTLIGGNGTDTLYGGDGADILYGGAGADTLNGGAGADAFIFEAASAFGAVDTISDFNAGQGDALNIADLLTGYDPLTDAITDFVQITTSGSNSILKVDADGGADNFVQIATLNGITGLTDEESLETNGYLIAA